MFLRTMLIARHVFVTALGLLLLPALHGEVKVLKNFTLIDGTGRAPAPRPP